MPKTTNQSSQENGNSEYSKEKILMQRPVTQAESCRAKMSQNMVKQHSRKPLPHLGWGIQRSRWRQNGGGGQWGWDWNPQQAHLAGAEAPGRYSSARNTPWSRENMLTFSFLCFSVSHHSQTYVARSHLTGSLRNEVYKELWCRTEQGHTPGSTKNLS